MKSNLLKLITACFTLAIIVSPTLTMAQSKTQKDTTIVLSDTVKVKVTEAVDDDFSEMEKELNELDKAKKGKDTTNIRIGKMKISVVEDGDDIIINKKNDDWSDDDWDEDWSWDDDDDFKFHRNKDRNNFNPHWASFSIGVNNYVTSDFSLSLPDSADQLSLNTNTSYEVNLNIAQTGFNIIKNRLGLVTGVGFKWNNYKFRDENTVLVSDSTPLHYFSADNDAKMSKLTTWYLTVPLLLEFQIPTSGDDLYISGGVEGSIKLSSHTKIKTNDKEKIKDKSDFYTTMFDYRLMARLGYGDFGIYGAYSMMPLFEKDKGPELYPIAVGVSFNF